MLAGHNLPGDWNWQAIRNEINPKETYFLRFAEQKNLLDSSEEGRKTLAEEAARRYDRIRQLCPEDIAELENRINSWIKDKAWVSYPGNLGTKLYNCDLDLKSGELSSKANNSILSDKKSSAYQINVSQALPRNNQRVATAYLQTHELQELADKIAEIKSAAAGVDLKFKVQIDLGGESQPSDSAIARINQLLHEISDNLELK